MTASSKLNSNTDFKIIDENVGNNTVRQVICRSCEKNFDRQIHTHHKGYSFYSFLPRLLRRGHKKSIFLHRINLLRPHDFCNSLSFFLEKILLGYVASEQKRFFVRLGPLFNDTLEYHIECLALQMICETAGWAKSFLCLILRIR